MNDQRGSGELRPSGSFEGVLMAGLDAISRRRFLSLLSASAALALGTSCSKIDRGSIVPYTRRPGESIPGVAAYYASTFQEGPVTHRVLVKTREGRPIHIEGNPENDEYGGTAGLRAIGDLLSLYDPDRLRTPTQKGIAATWEEAVKALSRSLTEAGSLNKSVLLLTGAVVSPSQRSLLADLKRAVPGLRHAAWEPYAPHAEISAARALYGEALLPALHVEKADVILSLQSDFLGTDPQAPAYIRAFAARRSIKNPTEAMNRLWVVEGNMSLTGFNADHRLPLRPSKMAALAFALIRLLNETHSLPLPAGMKRGDLKNFSPESVCVVAGIEPAQLRTLAADLAGSRKKAMVLAGSVLAPEAHLACHLLNCMLESEGNTIDMKPAVSEAELLTNLQMKELLTEAARGQFAAGIFWDANPAYAFPDNALWKKAIAGIPKTFRIGLYEDETALDCEWRLPEHHWLEGWGDFDSGSGFASLRQPVMGAIHNTRQAEDLFLACLRDMKQTTARHYLDYVKATWQSSLYPGDSRVPFEAFWNAALHDGGVRRPHTTRASLKMNPAAVADALRASAKNPAAAATNEMELILMPAAGVYDGRYANNGWLNELPDPVTKVTWLNPILLSTEDAARAGISDGRVQSILTDSGHLDGPVAIQPGQASGVAVLALGYGRRTGSVAAGIGVNAYSLMDIHSDSPYLIPVQIAMPKVPIIAPRIPRTQEHSLMDGRDLSRSWTLSEYSRKIDGKDKHGG